MPITRWAIALLSILVLNLSTSERSKADDPAGKYFEGTQVDCPGVPAVEAAAVQCNQMAFQKADRELNQAFQQLLRQADKTERKYLQDMQLAWIKLKEAQCGLRQYYYREARFSDKWKTHCEAVMTLRRVQELKALGTGIAW